MKPLILIGLMLTLTACSGGGGGSSAAPAAPVTSAAPATPATPVSTPATTPTTPAATPPAEPIETPAPTLGQQTALIQTVMNTPISQPLMDCLVSLTSGACNLEKVPLIGCRPVHPR